MFGASFDAEVTYRRDLAAGGRFGLTCYRGRMILGLGLLLLGIVVLVRWIRDRRQ